MNRIISFALLTVFFISCERNEIEEETPDGGVLDKMIVSGNGDSSITQFSYNAQGKLTGYITTEYPGAVVGFTYAFTRDNAGKITKAVSSEYNYPPFEVYATYQPGSSMLKYTLMYHNQMLEDSSAFVYSGGNVTEHRYAFNASTGQYTYIERIEYILQNGNVVKMKEYDITGGSSTPDMEVDYTYDKNLPPISQSFEEAYLADMEEMFGTNNLTKAVYSFPSFPSGNESTFLNYTYAKTGQPATGQMTSTAGPGALNFTFIYK
jgi:hypothetical protein